MKDFNQYAKEYIEQAAVEVDINEASFEVKMGLLKYLCDQKGGNKDTFIEILMNNGPAYTPEAGRIIDLLPEGFIESLF